MSAQVFVSVGSNINAAVNVRLAAVLLQREFGDLQLSTVYRSASAGFSGDDFLNLIIGFTTERSPHDCAAVMTKLEHEAGRSEDQHGFVSRPLDLDMVLYGDLVDTDPALRVPRDDIDKYAFVLGPLAEIAPGFRHPLNGKTMAELWTAFDQSASPMTVEPIKL